MSYWRLWIQSDTTGVHDDVALSWGRTLRFHVFTAGSLNSSGCNLHLWHWHCQIRCHSAIFLILLSISVQVQCYPTLKILSLFSAFQPSLSPSVFERPVSPQTRNPLTANQSLEWLCQTINSAITFHYKQTAFPTLTLMSGIWDVFELSQNVLQI